MRVTFYIILFAFFSLMDVFAMQTSGIDPKASQAQTILSKLAKGTVSEIKTVIPEMLYTAEFTRDDGSKLYFAYERVNETNEGYWMQYIPWASFIASYAQNHRLVGKQTSDFLGTETPLFAKPSVEQTKAGIAGFKAAMVAYLKYKENPEFKFYIAYISTKPVTKPHVNFKTPLKGKVQFREEDMEPKSLKMYEEQYGDIVMSVSVLMMNYAPTRTHLGIYHNPLFEARKEGKYSGLSMRLQGFSAEIQFNILSEAARKEFKDNLFLTTQPVKIMTKIFVESMPDRAVHLGFINERDTTANPETQEMLKKHPPILKRGSDNVISIVKGGANGEVIYKGIPGKPFDFTHEQITLGSPEVVADLSVLAKHWTLKDPVDILKEQNMPRKKLQIPGAFGQKTEEPANKLPVPKKAPPKQGVKPN